jgi:hypothetical protein
MSDKDLYGKEDFLHKGTSHIMDSKSPGRVPKYYHGKEINRKNQFLGGNKEARQRGTLLTRGGGKGGWIRKLVNSITGNPLE